MCSMLQRLWVKTNQTLWAHSGTGQVTKQATKWVTNKCTHYPVHTLSSNLQKVHQLNRIKWQELIQTQS